MFHYLAQSILKNQHQILKSFDDVAALIKQADVGDMCYNCRSGIPRNFG